MESSHLEFELNTIAVVVGLAFIFIYYLQPWKPKSKNNKPPEPAGAWPVLGHLPLLPPHELLHRKFGAMADMYGPIFMIRLGTRRALVVSNSELAKECLVTNDRALATRPYLAAAKHMGYSKTVLGFAPYGPFWREMRKISTLELLSSHSLQMLKHVRVSEIDTAIKDLYEKYWAKNSGKQGQPEPVQVEMRRWFEALTLNVVVRMIAGKQHYGKTDFCDNEESRRCRKVVSDFVYLMGVFVASDALPILKWFDLKGFEGAMKKTFKDFDGILSRWLKEHRLRKGNRKEHDEDFMDVMLSKMDNVICGYDTDIAIKSTCLALVVAGNDTTAATLTWALSLLLNHRHVLRKAQAELDSKVGRDRQVEESDIMNLVYLHAIIKETLRLYPPAPLNLPHEAMENCTIGGFDVPAGTTIITNLWKIQRDPHLWTDPLKFKPERFLTTHAEVDFRGQHFQFIPFSSGRRMCPGISLAVHVLSLTLARLIHEFKLETPSGTPTDMTEGLGTTLPKATPLNVLFTPRLPTAVYGNTVVVGQVVDNDLTA